ncbi:MAG: hypothetical protein F9K23_08760 [Bacteroidetes bacterium]|nr:MAG: hypothetical protein F9K23_08760 [Bacteroidota bacterium]
MKKIAALTVFLVSVLISRGQVSCESISEALDHPSYCEGVIINPYETRKTNKFLRRINKFDALSTVYLQRGFTADELKHVINGIKHLELDEVIVECDSLTGLIEILAGLQTVDKITLIEPFTLRSEAFLDIKKLKSPALTLNSSTRVKLPKDFEFPEQLEEIEILSKQPSKNDVLVGKLIGLEKLTSVLITTESISSLPAELKSLTKLKNLEVIKAKDIDAAEADLVAKRFRMAKEGHECTRLLSITYNTMADMSDAERQAFTSLFSDFYLLGEKENQEKPAATANEVANADVFASTVGFKPLLPQADVKRKVFNIPAESAVSIKVNSGTKITIPQDAFVDATGKPVTGNVNITYREIITPLDMLMSGVPMAYDSGGVTNQFVSAGNFELLAFKEGEPLTLAQDKTIDVEFVSADANNGFNLYKLNPETANWEFEGTADNREKPAQDSTKSKPLQIVDTDFTYGFDTTVFEERFANVNYRYMLDENEKQGDVGEIAKSRKGRLGYRVSKIIGKQRTLFKVQVDAAEKVKADSVHQVKFKLYTGIAKSKHPFFNELIAFKGYTFYAANETTRKEFKKMYVRKQQYNDVRIEYEKGNDYCTIRLKTAKGFIDLVADITQGKSGFGETYAKQAFARRYKRYERSLNKRIERLNNALEQRKKMARIGLEGYVDDGTMRGAVGRTLRLTGLGVFNCDAFYKFDIPPTVIADVLVKTQDTTITPLTVFVVDRKINGLLTYSSSYVSLSKKSTKTIIAIGEDETVYCIDGKAENAVGRRAIAMKKVDASGVKNAKQFAELVGL